MNILVPQKQSAYSLVFAFLVMTVVMIIASTTIENTTNKVRYFNELEGTSQARLAAESAAEMAIQEIKNYEYGYDPPDSSSAFCLDPDAGTCTSGSVGTAYGGYKVYSKATENDNDGNGYYYLPIPGTGTAGNSDDCSLLNNLSIDHPCNWNKWMYGETVTLPLYSVNPSGSFESPYDTGISEWVLKVRTPCIGDYEEGCTRYTFEADNADISTDPSLILWQVTGENEDGTISLYPNDKKHLGLTDYIKVRSTSNTEIPASFIDDGYDLTGDFEVFSMSDVTELETYMTSDSTVTSLGMQLDLITTLVNTTDNTAIPYLEWQVYMDQPLVSPLTAIKGEGYYVGSEGTYYFPYVITKSVTGESASIYTLAN